MMEKEVRQGGFQRGTFFQPGQNIAGDHTGEPVAPTEAGESRFRNDRLSVDKENPGSVAALGIGPQENRAEEGAVSGPEVRQRGGWTGRMLFRKPTSPKTDLAEKGVKTPKIAAAGLSRGIVGAKRVEDFGGEHTGLHRRTSRNAPKLEKPAPKEASHQRPSGTPL